MATLTNSTIASTYTMLLKMKDTGIDGTLNKIESGDADDGALALSTTAIGIDTTDTMHFDGANGDFSASDTYIKEGATDRLDFVVGGDVDGFILLESGGATSVGIGTTAPKGLLHVEGVDPTMYIQDYETTDADSKAYIHFTDTGSDGKAQKSWRLGKEGSDGVQFSYSTDDNDTGAGYTKLVTINTSGALGLGTDDPNGLLHLFSDADNGPTLYLENVDTDNNEGGNIIYRVKDSNSDLVDNQILGDIVWQGWNNSKSGGAGYNNAAIIRCRINGTPDGSDQDMPAELAFYTTEDNGALGQRMTITHNGKVGIGNTAPSTLLDIVKTATTGALPETLLTLSMADEGATIIAGEGPAIDFFVAEHGSANGISGDVSGKIAVVRESGTEANSAAAMVFWTGIDDSSASERLRITSTGDFGINVTVPEDTLHVRKEAVDADAAFFDSQTNGIIIEDGDAGLQIMSNDSGSQGSTIFLSNANLAANNTDTWFFEHYASSDSRLGIGYHDNQTSDEGVVSNGEERFTILPNGHVGIGESDPITDLQIVNPATDKYSTIYLGDNGGDAQGSGLIYSGNTLRLGADGDVRIFSDGNNSVSADIIFGQGSDTNLDSLGNFPYGGAAPNATHMTIEGDSGHVGIGVTNPVDRLHVTDDESTNYVARFEHTDATGGADPRGVYIKFGSDLDNADDYFLLCGSASTTKMVIRGDGDVAVGGVVLSSDRDMKENIVDATSKLDDLLKLKVRNFNWKSKYKPDSSKKIGFIAQEVEEVFPALVREHPSPLLEEADAGIMKKDIFQAWEPIIIKAIQELSAKVTALENA